MKTYTWISWFGVMAFGLTCLCAVSAAAEPSLVTSLVDKHCIVCHGDSRQKGDLNLEAILPDDPSLHLELWEAVVHKLRARQMPPIKRKKRPTDSEFKQVVLSLGAALDEAAAKQPNPGRVGSLRRLNRTEYQNAIRDLLALDIDASVMLPADESSYGFDNVTVGDLSPTLLDRYITVAQKISRLAVGSPRSFPGGDTFRVPPDRTQEKHVEGLPLGTRGGVLLPYTFPQDGEYEIQIRLARDRNEYVEGLNGQHEVELLLDRKRMALFTVVPPENTNAYFFDDEQLKTRIRVTAGPHDLGVTFLKKPCSLLETKRQPYEAHFNMHRHPRITPAVNQVSITGPYGGNSSGDTPSRRQIFTEQPTNAGEEEGCAKSILSKLIRRAYRRPVTDSDLERPMEFYRKAHSEAGFEAGIESALSAILVSPRFLFRIERDPADVAPGEVYRISDLELAARLSFFLWSSIPDDELLDAAIDGKLGRSEGLEKQVRRMLADPRSRNLANNFASQWLYLRNLESKTPDQRLFPDFDDNLRQAFREETERFVESILREDRSVLVLLKSDYTFLNERLAKHYGIPNVYGSRFRRVELDKDSHRGGLLRHGSILTVTSYATRTSPVVRGKWILENILGTPPLSPLPDVPSLKDNVLSEHLSVRERLAQHRSSPVCASCHNLIDPPGFALENYDAVGRWREIEEGKPVDNSAGLPDGSVFSGMDGLEAGLLNRPELFVGTLTEKLLTFALGRGVEYYDAPAVRKIVREAAEQDYRFAPIIIGIVKSTPFTMRKAL